MAQRATGSGALVAGGADLHPVEPIGCLGTASRAGAGARRGPGHGFSRRNFDPGAPQSGGGAQKGGSGAQRDGREALGRSRGGYGTKACVITDGAGRALRFALAPGPAHELPLAQDLVECLPDVPGWVVGDKGYASHAFRQFIWDQGARPAIPAKKNEAPVACPSWIYNNRNRVERLWARLKEWRAVATRYEKTAASFMGVLCLAAVFDWIKQDIKP